MVSFGVALQDQIIGSFLRSGVFDTITVDRRRRSRLPARRLARSAGGRRRRRDGRDGRRARPPIVPTLDDEALKQIAALPRVQRGLSRAARAGGGQVRGGLRVLRRARRADVGTRRGRVPGHRRPAASSQRADEDACLISLEFARRLTEGEPKDLVGKSVTLALCRRRQAPASRSAAGPLRRPQHPARREAVPIVGIVERQAGPDAGAGLFAAVMIPLAKAREMGSVRSQQPAGAPAPDWRTGGPTPTVTVKVDAAAGHRRGREEDQGHGVLAPSRSPTCCRARSGRSSCSTCCSAWSARLPSRSPRSASSTRW